MRNFLITLFVCGAFVLTAQADPPRNNTQVQSLDFMTLAHKLLMGKLNALQQLS